MKKSVTELREVVEQLKRSINTLKVRIYKDETSNFAAGYNQSGLQLLFTWLIFWLSKQRLNLSKTIKFNRQ